MEDSQFRCPTCGTDYLSAVLNDMLPNKQEGVAQEEEPLLDSLEQSLHVIEQAPVPTYRETLRRMSPILYGIAVLMCVLAAVLTGANLFYLVAVVFSVLCILSLIWRLRHRHLLSQGELIVQAAARVFSEDSAAIRQRNEGRGDVNERLDTMQQRINCALQSQREAHAHNGRKIWFFTCLALFLAGLGIGLLAVHNHRVREKAAAYAAQPEWIKQRDRYLSKGIPDEYDGKMERESIIRAMLEAGESSEAESFFFTYCQGKLGDMECAQRIVSHYREKGASEALRAFAERVSLRYDSDTRKIRSIKP